MSSGIASLPAMQGSALLTIDLGALVSNWRSLAARVAPARCGAVVKANAYGLGAPAVVRSLLQAGCREFFVALVQEGVELIEALRGAWPADASIHVLHGPEPGAEGDCVAFGLRPVLNSLAQIERWRALAKRRQRPLRAAIQVDTGMARLGLAPGDLQRLLMEPEAMDGILPTLVMSHLASAEDPTDPVNAKQLALFQNLRGHLPGSDACLSNSSGIFLGPAYHFDLVRPGAALYGVAPQVGAPNPMLAVVRVQARLIQWREVGAGEAVGYNQSWVATRPSRIATVSVGYADGYLRSASNRARLRLNGVELPLVGRVSMDTATVDVTDVHPDQLAPGTLLDVIDEIQDVNALAAQAHPNAYEILTSLGSRYRRRYLNEI